MNKLLLSVAVLIVLTGCQRSAKNEAQEVVKKNGTAFSGAIITDQFIDGQPVEYYLKSRDIDQIVLDYYYGKIEIKENEETGDLLNTLIQEKGELTPLYFHCFMNICKNNGKHLENYLGNYCIKLLREKTYYCIKKLHQGSPDYFTGLVANEIYKNSDWETEINNIALELHRNLEDEAPDLRKELDLFLVGLKNDIEHLSEPSF